MAGVSSFYGFDKNAPQLKAAMYVLNQRPLKMPPVAAGGGGGGGALNLNLNFNLI